MIEPLPSQPALIDQVHDRLVAAIADGTLPPGHRMTQEEVAASLGVSRQPVSHALQILRRRGLVLESGKRGLIVAPLDGRRIRDLYQVRAAIEGLAASLAAARVRAGALPKAERDELRAALEAGRALADDGSIGALIAADVALHACIHRLSGNGAIVETVAEAWPHFRRAMGVVLGEPPVRRQVWQEHAAIVSAILGGEPEAAERAARSHIERAGCETAERLEQLSSVA